MDLFWQPSHCLVQLGIPGDLYDPEFINVDYLEEKFQNILY